MLSHFSRAQLIVTLWSAACQAPLSMRFSRQEYWSGLPCCPTGHLPGPRIEPMFLVSPALTGRFVSTSTIWESPLDILSLKFSVNKLDLQTLCSQTLLLSCGAQHRGCPLFLGGRTVSCPPVLTRHILDSTPSLQVN